MYYRNVFSDISNMQIKKFISQRGYAVNYQHCNRLPNNIITLKLGARCSYYYSLIF